MSLKQQIQDDVKTAMKAKDSARLGAIRLLTAAIKQKEVDERIELDDTQVLAIIEKQIKQRKDSIEQFARANREDLIAQEQFELGILKAYQPAQLSEAEITAVIAAAKAATGAASPADMGKLIAAVKPQLAGKADMGLVSKMVKAALS